MPAKKKSIETTEIKCSSKLTYQLDNRTWYSFEESRIQSLNGLDEEEAQGATDKLWDVVNGDIDNQLELAINANKPPEESNNKLDK